MEFFNKKQDVLDIQLTGYGKQLLSKGIFKPAYYAFSDDGIMYDVKWVSGSAGGTAPEYDYEEQSEREPRIQEDTPRFKTQYRTVGAERAIEPSQVGPMKYTAGGEAFTENVMDLFEFSSQQEFFDLFDWSELKQQFVEAEKLLENVLGYKSYYNAYNPAWNALFYNGHISSSTKYYKKNDITQLVPQLNCTLTDIVYKMDADDPEADPFSIIPEANNIQSMLNNALIPEVDVDNFDGLEAMDFRTPETMYPGSDSAQQDYFGEFALKDGKMFLIKDFLFLSLEEANVEFTTENFTVEVFEITTTKVEDDGEETLEKMSFSFEKFGSYSSYAKSMKFNYFTRVESVFDIQIDDEINSQLACALIGKDEILKNQSIYISNVFDCAALTPDTGVDQDPYSNLPDADVEDVC